VENADFEATTALFGKKNGDRTLDNFIPKSESDFLDYAELVAQKIRPYEVFYRNVSFHTVLVITGIWLPKNSCLC
jgi:translation initiation factor 3 subunit J